MEKNGDIILYLCKMLSNLQWFVLAIFTFPVMHWTDTVMGKPVNWPPLML